MARFEIEVFTRFREEGIANIGRRIRDELRSIANDRSLTPAQQATRVGEARLGTTAAVAALRNDALRGLQPGSPEYAAIQRQFSAAQSALTRVFREVEQGSTRLGREIQAILTRAGISLPGAAAVAGARANPLAPLAAAGAAQAGQAAAVNAQVQTMLAADQEYVRETAAAARAKAQIAADVQGILAADRDYIQATAAAASAKASSTAQIQTLLAADTRYINAQAATARAKAQQQAAIQGTLASDTAYAGAQAAVARAKAQQQAQVAQLLATDTAYSAAQIGVARERARQQASIQEGLAADRQYIVATAAIATARAQTSASVARTLASDADYVTAQAVAARAKAVQAAATQQILASDRTYAAAQAVTARAKAQQSAQTAQILAADRDYTRAQAVSASAKARSAAELAQMLAADRDYTQAQAAAAAAKSRSQASIQQALAADRDYAQSQAAVATAKAQQRAETAAILAADEQYTAAQVSAARDKARQNAQVQEALAADQAYISAQARAAAARSQLNAAIRAQTAALGNEISVEQQAINALRTRIAADRQATQTALLMSDAQSDLGRQATLAAAQRRIAEARVTASMHALERANVAQAIAAGEGTRFQRLLARAQFGGQNRTPTELPTFGQFVGSRAATTVGYGIAGAALYGGVRVLGDMIKEAEELEKVMNQIEAQFQSIGSPQEVPGVREGILGIARRTGLDAEEVAESFRLLRGAFDSTEEAIGPTAVALRETEAAMQIARVTGLQLGEVFDSLTATALSFDVSIESIGDTAVGLSERFGVPAKEIIQFVADIAPLGRELGFTADELAAVGAAAQRVSGRSGAALAEAFGRVVPQIAEVQDEILNLYQTVPGLQGRFDEVLGAFSRGDIGDVFFRIVRDYQSLNKAQQNYELELLGGRRETQALAAVLSNSAPLIEELDAQMNNAGRDAGRLSDYFTELRTTVSNTADRMAESFRQVGEALFELGLADVLVTAATAATMLAQALSAVIGFLGDANGLTGGWAGRIAFSVLAIAGLAKGINFLIGLRGRSAAAAAAEAVGEVSVSTAKGITTIQINRQTAALTAETTAEGFNTASARANAFAEGTQAAAKGATAGAAGRAGLLARGRAAIGAIGAAGLSTGVVVGGAVVTGALIKSQFDRQDRGLQEQEDKVREELKEFSRRRLEEIAGDTSDFWDRVASNLFGIDLPAVLAEKELRSRDNAPQRQQFQNLVGNPQGWEQLVNGLTEPMLETLDQVFVQNTGDLKIDPEFTREKLTKAKIDELIKQAAEGDPFATNIINLLNSFARDNLGLANLLNNKTAEATEAQQEAAGTRPGTIGLQKVEEVMNRFEVGAVGESTVIKTMQERINLLRTRQRAGGGAWSTKDADDLANLEKQMSEFIASRARDNLDRMDSIRQLTGKDTAGTRMADLSRLLGGQSSLDLNTKLELLPDAIEAIQEAFNEELEGIEDPIERAARAKEGFEIPGWLRSLVIVEQLRNTPGMIEFVNEIATITGQAADAIISNMATTLINLKGDSQAAITQAIRERINRLKGELADTTGLHIGSELDRQDYLKEIARLEGLLPKAPNVSGVRDPGTRGGVNADKQRSLDEAAKRERERRAEEAKRAREEAERAAEDAARARIDLLKAQAGKDPVRLAQLEIDAANLAARQAKTEAEALRAQAQQVNASRALQDAQLDLWSSMQEYYAAVATVAGDAVRTTEIELSIVRERLRVLTDQGFGHTAEANRLRAELVRAEGALRDTTFQDQLGDIDFLLEMERISTGQAIEMLRAMMSIPTNTEEMNRNLERRIKQLQSELSQDFQFNLPSELQLPTLYEVRRLAQTAQGQSYQDNRQITVNFQANNVADAQAIAQGIADQFGAPSRFGTTPKRYP